MTLYTRTVFSGTRRAIGRQLRENVGVLGRLHALYTLFLLS